MSQLINNPLTYYAVGAVILACVVIRIGSRPAKNPNDLPLPPVPRGYASIGNLLQVPKLEAEPWRVYDAWRKIHGDMIYFEVFGQPFLVLGTLEKVQELFDEKSSKYSNRPGAPMIRDLMGWDFDFAFHPYGQLWPKDRRAFHDHFHSGVVEGYQPMQLKEAHVFLQLLMTEPDNLLHHVRHAFSATIMRVAYGVVVKPRVNSVYVTAAEAAVTTVSLAAIPGTFLVDVILALKYVPRWFPGASFKKKAPQWRKELNQFIDLPFNHVKQLMAAGKAIPSLLTKLLDAGLAHAVSEDDEFNGYFIPEGTIVMGNTWAILHDPEVFDSPEEFIPERYIKDGKLNPDVRDPSVAAFGFGRRICPGRHFAEQNLVILIASTLAAFDIRALVDASGTPIINR